MKHVLKNIIEAVWDLLYEMIESLGEIAIDFLWWLFSWLNGFLPSQISDAITSFRYMFGGDAGATLESIATVAGWFLEKVVSIDVLYACLVLQLVSWPIFMALRVTIYLKGHFWSASN